MGAYEIGSMREDWHPVLGRAHDAVAGAAAELRQFAASTEGSQHQTVRDAVAAAAAVLSSVAGDVQDIDGLSRQVDADRWAVADSPRRPDDQVWTN